MRLGVEAALVGGALVPGDVEVVEGRVSAYGLSSPRGRGIAAPGFVDLQVNGFAGVDFLAADASGYARAGRALVATGVTAYLPTLVTAPEERLVEAVGSVPLGGEGPRILGVHLEGPFLAPGRLGAHPAAFRRDPDPALLERLLAAGPVRLVTLAPELPGGLDLVRLARGRGVAVSLGHSDATAEEAHAAFDRGATAVTHLFNAMRPFHHRDPGLAGAALARPDVALQVIVDGVHLAPDTVRLVWQAAAGRVALVTDATALSGSESSSASLGEATIERGKGAPRLPGGVLAGSVLTMAQAVRNLHALGVPLERALEAASLVPARILGARTLGRLDVGLPADVVVLDDRLEVQRVLVEGRAALAG